MSATHRKSAKKNTTTIVMIVVLMTSVRDGQETFFISCTTSRKNWRTFAIQPSGFETNCGLFCSSVIGAGPSRVLDVAIVITSTVGYPYLICAMLASSGETGVENEQGYQDSNPNFRFWRPTCYPLTLYPFTWFPYAPCAYGKNDRTS